MKLPSAPVRILAAAAVLAAGLVGMVVRENMARDAGQEVRIALAGYDPRSLLQGHYVQFNLSPEVPGGQCPPTSQRRFTGEPEWVALRRTGDHHVVAGVAESRREAAKLGEVVARGTALCSVATSVRMGDGPAVTREEARISLDLGVDRIHLDQAQAEATEADLRRARPAGGPPGYAVLSIGRDGRARVKGLIVGKRRIDLDWF